MIVLVVLVLMLLGGTTWFATAQPWPARPGLQHQLTGLSLIASLLAIIAMVLVAAVTSP